MLDLLLDEVEGESAVAKDDVVEVANVELGAELVPRKDELRAPALGGGQRMKRAAAIEAHSIVGRVFVGSHRRHGGGTKEAPYGDEVGGRPLQIRARFGFEFGQQGRDVELDGAFGDVEA